MLSFNNFSVVFSFLQSYEVASECALVSKKFERAAVYSFTARESIEINYGSLGLIFSKCPNLTRIKIRIAVIYDQDFICCSLLPLAKLSKVTLIFLDKISPRFPIKRIIGIDVLSRLEKIIMIGKDLSSAIAYLPYFAKACVKQKCLTSGGIQPFNIPKLEATPQKPGIFFYDTITRKERWYFKEIYKKLTINSMFSQEIPFANLKKIDLRECKGSLDFGLLGKSINQAEYLKKVYLCEMDISEFITYSIFEKNQNLESIKLSIKNYPVMITKEPNAIIDYVRSKPRIKSLNIMIADLGLFWELADWVLEFIVLSLASKQTLVINGIPIKKFLAGKASFMKLKFSNLAINMMDYAIYLYFFDLIPQVAHIRYKNPTQPERFFSVQAFRSALNSENKVIKSSPIIEYILNYSQFNEKIDSLIQFISIFSKALNLKFPSSAIQSFYQRLALFNQNFPIQVNKIDAISRLKTFGYHFEGHTDKVLCICNLPHQNLIATGSADTRINLYDSSTFSLRCSFSPHKNPISSLSANSTHLVSGSSNGSVALLDLNTLQIIKVFTGHTSPVTSVFILNTMCISGSYDCYLKIWHTEVVSILHKCFVKAVAADERYIFSGCSDYKVYMWRASDFALEKVLNEHNSTISCIRVIDEGILVGGKDGKVVMWDGERVEQVYLCDKPVRALDTEQGMLAVAYLGGVVLVEKDGQEIMTVHYKGGINGVCFVKQGCLGYVTDNKGIYIINLHTSENHRIFDYLHRIDKGVEDIYTLLLIKYLTYC